MTPNYSNRVILGDGSDFETTLSKGEGGGGEGGGGGEEKKPETGNPLPDGILGRLQRDEFRRKRKL